MKNWLRFPTLVLSAMLHLAPLMRVAVAESAVAASPLLAVLRWVTGATALAGAFHGVSGATGLTITQGSAKVTSVTATNGVQAAGFRMSIVSSIHGTAASYTFRNLPAGMTGSLQGVVTGIPTASGNFTTTVTGWQNAGGRGDNYSTTFLITVLDQAPAIVVPPVSLSVAVGDPVTLTATVTGTGLTYRWLKDDIELAAPAGTAASYVIAAARLADAGRYKLRISNTGGTVVSTEAVLTVVEKAPTVVTPPASLSVSVGDPVTLSATVTGTGLSYQWLRDDVQLAAPAGTAASYVIASAKLTDAGRYKLRVSNTGGTVVSADAVLTVTQAGPTISAQPVSREVHAGEAVTFSVTATSGGPVTYQWLKGTQAIPGATTSALSFSAVTAADAATYSVNVISGGTTVPSKGATLTVAAGLAAAVGSVGADGATTVNVNTIAGRSYVMEEANDIAGLWSAAQTVTATAASTAITSAPASGSGTLNRFWRVRVVPITQ